LAVLFENEQKASGQSSPTRCCAPRTHWGSSRNTYYSSPWFAHLTNTESALVRTIQITFQFSVKDSLFKKHTNVQYIS